MFLSQTQIPPNSFEVAVMVNVHETLQAANKKKGELRLRKFTGLLWGSKTLYRFSHTRFTLRKTCTEGHELSCDAVYTAEPRP